MGGSHLVLSQSFCRVPSMMLCGGVWWGVGLLIVFGRVGWLVSAFVRVDLFFSGYLCFFRLVCLCLYLDMFRLCPLYCTSFRVVLRWCSFSFKKFSFYHYNRCLFEYLPACGGARPSITQTLALYGFLRLDLDESH